MRRFGFYLLLIIVCLYFLGPFIWQTITSLKPASELTSLPPLLPQDTTSRHYVAVFREHPFLRLMVNGAGE